MDSRLEGKYPSKAALQIAQLALKCLGPEPKQGHQWKKLWRHWTVFMQAMRNQRSLELILHAVLVINVARSLCTIDLHFTVSITELSPINSRNEHGNFNVLIFCEERVLNVYADYQPVPISFIMCHLENCNEFCCCSGWWFVSNRWGCLRLKCNYFGWPTTLFCWFSKAEMKDWEEHGYSPPESWWAGDENRREYFYVHFSFLGVSLFGLLRHAMVFWFLEETWDNSSVCALWFLIID